MVFYDTEIDNKNNPHLMGSQSRPGQDSGTPAAGSVSVCLQAFSKTGCPSWDATGICLGTVQRLGSLRRKLIESRLGIQIFVILTLCADLRMTPLIHP